jgi:hypothetical protein
MLWNAQPSVVPMGLVGAGVVGERVDAACGAGMRAGVRACLGRWTLLRVRDHAPVFQPPVLVRAVPCVQRACALAPVGKGGRAETAGACVRRHSDHRVRAATTRRAADTTTRTAVYSPRHRHQMGTSPPRASCFLLTHDGNAQASCLLRVHISLRWTAVISRTQSIGTGGDYAKS